ncbi:DUF1077-domain-containing protein [Russula ochroleuca]|uniref:ER membrane protein complex subunit 4 n=1 Tax=Russula ochroleuca TaxID=152965 RepID=A0A9P5T7T5_9AGAM|nr:DUF1077-domain-containing protein [Russula ochroleuca]
MSPTTTTTSLNYASLEPSNPKWSRLPPPPGFAELSKGKLHGGKSSVTTTSANTSATAAYEDLKKRKAWDFAISPLKSLPMQAFMLYMSGGGVQIFSMGIVAMLLLSPFKNLSSMNIAFAPFAPGPSSSSPSANSLSTLPLQKLAYLVCNVLTLALGLWKCRSMGLLPTGTGDWLAFESRGPAPEISLF